MELGLVASHLRSGVPPQEVVHGGVQLRGWDLSVPTHQSLQHSIMDEDILLLLVGGAEAGSHDSHVHVSIVLPLFISRNTAWSTCTATLQPRLRANQILKFPM